MHQQTVYKHKLQNKTASIYLGWEFNMVLLIRLATCHGAKNLATNGINYRSLKWFSRRISEPSTDWIMAGPYFPKN